jgi:hypothetical protein
MRFFYLALALVLLLTGLVGPTPVLADSSATVPTLSNTISDNPSVSPVTVTAPDYAPLAAVSSGKWIDVNLSKQKLVAYVGRRAVNSSLVSTGIAGKRTPTGTFRIKDHVRSQLMAGPGYYLPNVPYVMHFWGHDAIHGTYWHHNFGHPMSHGCINLPTSFARWLYYWAPNGTKVYIHY